MDIGCRWAALRYAKAVAFEHRTQETHRTQGTRSLVATALAGKETQPDRPDGVVSVGVEQADRLPGAERQSTLEDGDRQRRRGEQRHDVVGAVARRAMAMPVQPLLTRKQSIERIEQVVVRTSADLDHDEACGRMWDEHRQQAVVRADVIEERRTGGGQVGETSGRTGPDAEFAGLYGKMLRSASRNRPIPPPAGADS